MPSSSQPMVLMSSMSECDSTAFNEECLATTLDRKNKQNQCGNEETCFQNGM